jgi:hypothetical protein
VPHRPRPRSAWIPTAWCNPPQLHNIAAWKPPAFPQGRGLFHCGNKKAPGRKKGPAPFGGGP